MAEEERLAAQFQINIEIAKAQRDYEVSKAAFDQEVLTKKAQAKLAYDIQVTIISLSSSLISLDNITL